MVFSIFKLALFLDLGLSAMSNTSDAVSAQESVREIVAQNHIYYATLSVLVYDIGNMLSLIYTRWPLILK